MIFYIFFISNKERSFIQHNKKQWKRNPSPDAEVVVDLFYVPDVLIAYSYFLNTIANEKKAVIKKYIYNDGLIHPLSSLVYRSFCAEETLRIKLNRVQQVEVLKLVGDIGGKIASKEDLFNLEFEGINIGIDIYESYLRDYNQPTLDIFDKRLFSLLEIAFELAIFWRDYFSNNNVVGFVVSHESYIWMDIGCRLAHKFKVPVYLPNPRGVTYAAEPFSVYKCLEGYPRMFRQLSIEKQEKGKELAKVQLEKRLNGAVGVDMHYSTKTAFTSNFSRERILGENDKTKILIASHCFYDNPHGLNKMPYLDFYEWLHFLGEVSLETDYEWYIKIHPDPLPGTVEIIRGIMENYPQIGILPTAVSHNQLVEEGIDCVVTCYGTIGEEYPLLGVNVLNCAYNPRIAYSFNWHAESKNDLRNKIININSLDKKIKSEELYEFYFMHRYFLWVDDLIFTSYRAFLTDVPADRKMTGDSYQYFLDQFSLEKHRQTISNFRGFIHSKDTYQSVIGPIS